MFFPYLLAFHIFVALSILTFYFHDVNYQNGEDLKGNAGGGNTSGESRLRLIDRYEQYASMLNIGRIVTVIGAVVSGLLTMKYGFDYFNNKKK